MFGTFIICVVAVYQASSACSGRLSHVERMGPLSEFGKDGSRRKAAHMTTSRPEEADEA